MNILGIATLLSVTAGSVLIFLFGNIMVNKCRKERPLVARINEMEKALLVKTKENQVLIGKFEALENEKVAENERVSNESYAKLQSEFEETLLAKAALEEQIQGLEKELEKSTELGLELNQMLSDILNSQNGSETLMTKIEQLQKQLVEQQTTINSTNTILNLKDTENHELQLELDINHKKVIDLQAELDKMALNLLEREEENDQVQNKYQKEVLGLNEQVQKLLRAAKEANVKQTEEMKILTANYMEMQRKYELKSNEYRILKETLNDVKNIKNDPQLLSSILEVTSIKSELQQLQMENHTLNDKYIEEQDDKYALERELKSAVENCHQFKTKYDEADKEKLEALTKLEVLSNYFKEKEAQLQK